jgi:uroporphyrinogen decarboxylase
MTKKEAFKKAVSYEEIRPVPYNIKFTNEALRKYTAYRGGSFDPVIDTGSYVVTSHTNNGWEEIKRGYFRDYFGVVWNKTIDTTLGIVQEPPMKKASFRGYTFPNTEELPVYDFVPENNRLYPDHFHTLSIGFALWERAWSLVGMEQLMVYLMMEPAFVHDLLDRITDYNIAVIRKAASIGGIDGVYMGDDWAGQNGLLIGSDLWREFMKPRYKRTCEAIKAEGLMVLQHCCGKVEELIPDMIECGTQVFNPFQPEVMDIWAIKEKYKGQIAFWGGLSVQETLPRGTAKEVAAESELLLEKMAEGGGYIFSASHALTGDIPMENIDVLIEVARSQ